MACYLRIGGADFNPEDFLQKTGFENAKIIRKGDRLPGREYADDFRVQLTASAASQKEPVKQIEETIAFLEANRERLEHIKTTSGIEFAVIHFGVELNIPLLIKKWIRMSLYPVELTSVAGALGIGIAVTNFADFGEWDSRKSRAFLSRMRKRMHK